MSVVKTCLMPHSIDFKLFQTLSLNSARRNETFLVCVNDWGSRLFSEYKMSSFNRFRAFISTAIQLWISRYKFIKIEHLKQSYLKNTTYLFYRITTIFQLFTRFYISPNLSRVGCEAAGWSRVSVVEGEMWMGECLEGRTRQLTNAFIYAILPKNSTSLTILINMEIINYIDRLYSFSSNDTKYNNKAHLLFILLIYLRHLN